MNGELVIEKWLPSCNGINPIYENKWAKKTNKTTHNTYQSTRKALNNGQRHAKPQRTVLKHQLSPRTRQHCRHDQHVTQPDPHIVFGVLSTLFKVGIQLLQTPTHHHKQKTRIYSTLELKHKTFRFIPENEKKIVTIQKNILFFCLFLLKKKIHTLFKSA